MTDMFILAGWPPQLSADFQGALQHKYGNVDTEERRRRKKKTKKTLDYTSKIHAGCQFQIWTQDLLNGS